MTELVRLRLGHRDIESGHLGLVSVLWGESFWHEHSELSVLVSGDTELTSILYCIRSQQTFSGKVSDGSCVWFCRPCDPGA